MYRDGNQPDLRDHPTLSVMVDRATLIGVRVLDGSCFHAKRGDP
jgi:hypothetical protein